MTWPRNGGFRFLWVSISLCRENLRNLSQKLYPRNEAESSLTLSKLSPVTLAICSTDKVPRASKLRAAFYGSHAPAQCHIVQKKPYQCRIGSLGALSLTKP
ncbi:MAG: hypothetical protein ABFS56_12160 [Pseudomonadota bacterium]